MARASKSQGTGGTTAPGVHVPAGSTTRAGAKKNTGVGNLGVRTHGATPSGPGRPKN